MMSGGYNPYTVTHSVNSLRIGQVIYKICYPDDDLKRAIEKIVKPQLIEFAFCVSKSDIFHCLLSFLRQNPDVIRLVRAYLSTVSSMIVQQPSPKDIKFGIGAHKCENLLKLVYPIVCGNDDMSVGNNAIKAAHDLVMDACANGIRILVSTTGGGFVEDTTEGSVKRVAKQLKILQYNETNRVELNEASRDRHRAKRSTQIELEAKQLRALIQNAMIRKDLINETLQDFILSLVHKGEIDADTLLKNLYPVVHLTGKDPFKQQTALCLFPATIKMLSITSETRMILETGALLVSFVHYII